MRLGIDVDQVVADLHTPWLDSYNKLYNDRLTPADITDWEIENVVKPECGRKIYDLLTPEMYDDGRVQRIPHSWESVTRLRAKGYEITFISHCPTPDLAEVKFSWLVRNGFLSKTDQARFLTMKDKSRAPVDVLVDDSYENVRTFKGRYACLVTAPYNRLNLWLGMRCKDLRDFEARTPRSFYAEPPEPASVS